MARSIAVSASVATWCPRPRLPEWIMITTCAARGAGRSPVSMRARGSRPGSLTRCMRCAHGPVTGAETATAGAAPRRAACQAARARLPEGRIGSGRACADVRVWRRAGARLADAVNAHLARGGRVKHVVHDLDLSVVVARAQRAHLRGRARRADSSACVQAPCTSITRLTRPSHIAKHVLPSQIIGQVLTPLSRSRTVLSAESWSHVKHQ